MEVLTTPPPENENYMPTDEEYARMLEKLGDMGFAASYYNMDMVNYEQVLDFCAKAKAGEDAAVTIYGLRNYAVIAECFLSRNGRAAYLWAVWEFPRGGEAVRADFQEVDECDVLELTEKGFLLYLCREEGNSDWGGGYRVLPRGERLYELDQKYARGYDRPFANIMMVDWDADNLDALHMLEMVESFYRTDHGVSVYNDYPELYHNPDGTPAVNEEEEGRHYALPAAMVEEILQKHLPVTVEYLRSLPEYDAQQQVYDFYMTPRGGYGPYPELVEAVENDDGTLTLTFDAVMVESTSDRQFSNTITVQDNEDGSIKYLANTTDFWERNPYAHLQDQPLLPYPVSPENQATYDAGDEKYQQLCRALSPYLMTHDLDHMVFPGSVSDFPSHMQTVFYLFDNDMLEPEADYRTGGQYRYAMSDFWNKMWEVFPEMDSPSSSYLIDYAERHGFLTDDRFYQLPVEPAGYDGYYSIGWAEEQEDGTTTVSVYYSEDGTERSLLQFTFTLDLSGDSCKYISVTSP